MHRWIGGYYEDHYSVNPMWKPPFDKLPKHPITRGVGAVRHARRVVFQHALVDRSRGPEARHADPRGHAERRGPERPIREPQGPVRPYRRGQRPGRNDDVGLRRGADGGRGLGFTGGHTHANWGDANQRQIFLNGLLWLAKVDVPAKGVSDNITAEDLTQNLDVKGGRQRGTRRPLAPAEQLQRQREADDQPHAQRGELRGQLHQAGPLQHVRAQRVDQAVSGSALMIGCTMSGKRCAEKNTPDRIHIGTCSRFIRFETASIVRARRRDQQAQRAERQRREHARCTARSISAPAHRHAEHQRAEADRQPDLEPRGSASARPGTTPR